MSVVHQTVLGWPLPKQHWSRTNELYYARLHLFGEISHSVCSLVKKKYESSPKSILDRVLIMVERISSRRPRQSCIVVLTNADVNQL